MADMWYLVWEYAFLAACLLALGVGPPAALLWVWRRWGSRPGRAVRVALLPVAVFVLAGAAGAAVALVEVVAFSKPGRLGIFPGGRMGPVEYVAYTYWTTGARSVGVAALLAPVWGAVALGWRWLYPASFRRVTTPVDRRALSFAEQDYGDGLAPEPTDADNPPRS